MNLKKFITRFLFWAIITITAILLLAACSSSRKIKRNTQRHTDSSTVEVTDTSSKKVVTEKQVTITDSSATSKEEIVLDFAEEPTDSSEKQNDYEAAAPKKKPVYKYEIAGKKINSSTPLKKAVIKVENKTSQKATSGSEKTAIQQKTGKDSIATHVITNEQTQAKDKLVKKFPWMQAGLIAAILIALFYGLNKLNIYFGAYRRQNNESKKTLDG